MKKFFVSLLLISAVVFLQFCSSSKKASSAKMKAPKVTYAGSVQTLLVANCSPCHFPPKGNKRPLDTYAAAKANIDDVIKRIELNPTDRGFMPFKHPKLPDATIQAFVQWKADGMPEN